jgi:hypothetical protein
MLLLDVDVSRPAAGGCGALYAEGSNCSLHILDI